MGNNDLSNSENILVKVDQNNLVYIDPNSVIDDTGDIQPRGIRQENLAMYVNLEADLIPRSVLIADGDKTTLTSIAKGTLNLMKNGKVDSDNDNVPDGDFDSTWTDTYLQYAENPNIKGEFIQSDPTAQSFGIDSIQINIKGGSFIPQITINFIDVRGKTLFESPENSPYKAFFHLPWPIFYLTIKGYYGKAIRYRLHLVKFNTRYNDSNGNFEVTTTFVGSTYAYLNDIPLSGILEAPYMFMIESNKDPKKFNEKTQKYEKKVSKSSKGYSILKSVYDEYKAKGLIEQNFPVRTLRELITIAQTLDKILERKIFDQVVDMKIFAGIKDFEKRIQEFETAVRTWSSQRLSEEIIIINNKNYYLQKGLEKDKNSLNFIVGPTVTGTLEKIMVSYVEELKKSNLFANDLIQKGGKEFRNTTFNFVNTVGNIKDYYEIKDGKVVVAITELIEKILDIQKSFVEQRNKLEDKVEQEMNNIIKDPNKGIGFEPTVRNIFAVILANADTYIRLLKDTHYKAFQSAERRKNILKGQSDETDGENIYPWPEVKKQTASNKQKVIAYPGDPDLIQKLKSYDKSLWPEIDFVEEFKGVATKRIDPLDDKESSSSKVSFIFESDTIEYQTNNIGSYSLITKLLPYSDKTIANILYEIYERSKYTTFFDSFSEKSIRELALIEFENLSKSIQEDFDIIDILKENIKNEDNLKSLMFSFSTYDRYPYYKDQLPTVSYFKQILGKSHKLEYYIPGDNSKTNNDNLYSELKENLKNYKVEDYRKNIYPFNSNTYLSYLDTRLNKKNELVDTDFNFNGILSIDTLNGFICSPVNPTSWVKSGYTSNLFTQNLEITGKTFNILNTPYFHNQLYTEYTNQISYGKYVGSAYLLLNSLPFIDLEDYINFPFKDLNSTTSKTLTSSIFREVGSTHYIPYHLILKWGSIYHRYKKYVIDNVDIISGITNPIDTNLFFDFNSGITFTVSGSSVSYSGTTDVGIHPYYQNIFHQIVNDYSFYSTNSGNTSYSATTINGKNISRSRTKNSFNLWTSLVDNSKYYTTQLTYTLLPSDGNSIFSGITSFDDSKQTNFRVLWGEDSYTNEFIFSGRTFPSYNEYNRRYITGSTEDNKYSITGNYRKVIDLIGTFNPSILEEFETAFLEFSSENLEVEIPYRRYERIITKNDKTETYGVKHYNFQRLLKEIVTVQKVSSDPTDASSVISLVTQRQQEKLKSITKDILSNDNLLKLTISNPKEMDPYVLGGFTNTDVINFGYNTYDSVSQAPNIKYITLYLGEDIDGYYLDFFFYNNVELSEENVLLLRPLIQMYAGYRKNGGNNLKSSFITYLKNNIINKTSGNTLGTANRLSLFLSIFLGEFGKLTPLKTSNRLTIYNGYNDTPLKLELYNFFKSFNDKWVAGNSLGQRLLMEEFLFLDKANVDVGSKVFMSLEKLIPLEDNKNAKQNLYGVISMLITGSGFDMRALPAYINFYGTNFSNKVKLTPSKRVASNIFGTFLEVDYQEASPKIILQYVGPTSKHLDMKEISNKYKYLDDSFNVGNPNKNPLIITTPQNFKLDELAQSNKVVAFEVSFGDQNQGIFKGVQLDQSSIRNTTESFIAMENLGRSESGAGVYQVDVGLFDIYRQASYTCEVTCMGNVMIQPTMYFYLKNIPMFKGTYLITDVNHSIKGNNIVTSFQGRRIPNASLPDPKDSFLSSYRVLFDKVTNTAIARIKQESTDLENASKTEIVKNFDNGSYRIDMGSDDKKVQGEVLVDESGITLYGIPYNGFRGEKYIQKVTYENRTWLRAQAVEMGGNNYPIEDNIAMSIINQVTEINGFPVNITDKVTWSKLKDDKTNWFFSTKYALDVATPNKIIKPTTYFKNPNDKNGSIVIVSPLTYITTPKGPINIGPKVTGYGIGLSSALMKELKLKDGDVVYFSNE